MIGKVPSPSEPSPSFDADSTQVVAHERPPQSNKPASQQQGNPNLKTRERQTTTSGNTASSTRGPSTAKLATWLLATAAAPLAAAAGAPDAGGPAVEPRKLPPKFPDWKFAENWNLPCYSYAIDDAESRPALPGALSGEMYEKGECDSLMAAMRRDGAVPPLSDEGCHSTCEDGRFLVNARLATLLNYGAGKLKDVHFLRQDENGLWSQKDGLKYPTNLDESGNLIKCPDDANLNKGFFKNYDENCGYLCVENKREESAESADGPPQSDEDYPKNAGSLKSLAYVVGAGVAAYVLGGNDGAGNEPAGAAARPAEENRFAALAPTPRRIMEQLSSRPLSQTALKKALRSDGIQADEIKAALTDLEAQGLVRKHDNGQGVVEFHVADQA